jgi:hypothetical protein
LGLAAADIESPKGPEVGRYVGKEEPWEESQAVLNTLSRNW